MARFFRLIAWAGESALQKSQETDREKRERERERARERERQGAL